MHVTGDGSPSGHAAVGLGALLGALFGGEGRAQVHSTSAPDLLARTVYWQQVLPRISPVSRMVCAMVYDPKRDACVLMGGRGYIPPYRYVDTWELRGNQWVDVSPAIQPGQRSSAAFYFDRRLDLCVLFGGLDDWTYKPWGDTWHWDGAKWTQSSAQGPVPRFGPAMAFDPVRGVGVLFGGADFNTVFGDTWHYDGAKWTQVFPANSPPPRHGAVAAWDEARGRMVMFGGGSGATYLGDHWEWDGTTWHQVQVPNGPWARIESAMAYDANRERIILHGGNRGALTYGDTWEFDGLIWREITDTTRPTASQGHALAFDSKRLRTVRFGGFTGKQSGQIDETWIYAATNLGIFGELSPGCRGSNGRIPLLDADGRAPYTGSTFRFAARGMLPTTPNGLLLGGQRMTLDLTAYGLPGCTLGLRWDLILPGVSDANGERAVALPIPAEPTIVGHRFFVQMFTSDPTANAAGMVLSETRQGVIGRR